MDEKEIIPGFAEHEFPDPVPKAQIEEADDGVGDFDQWLSTRKQTTR